MSPIEQVLIEQAEHQLRDLIDTVNQTKQPIVIKSETNNAVLLSETDWTAIQETLYLLSVPGMRESIQEGLKTPIEECDRETRLQTARSAETQFDTM